MHWYMIGWTIRIGRQWYRIEASGLDNLIAVPFVPKFGARDISFYRRFIEPLASNLKDSGW